MFQSGDIKGALSTMAKVDPDHVANLIQTFQQGDPNTQGALKQAEVGGQMTAEHPFESTPGDVAHIGADARIAAAEARTKQVEDQIKYTTDPLSGLKFAANKKGAIQGFLGADGKLHSMDDIQGRAEQQAATSKASGEKPKLLANQDIDSTGQVVTILPAQQKIIKETRKTFDSETKDIVKGLEAAHQAQSMIEANNAGGEPLERLRLLRTVSPRPTQQEFQALGMDMGAVDSLENKLQKIATGKMTPAIQKDYLAIVNLMSSKLSQEYDQRLKNTVEKTPEVDSLILKKRLAGSGPTVYQAVAKKVSQLPAKDQAAFNWAHDNPNDARSKMILKNLGLQ